eukprot:CAMPEP_0201114588 /NCGR_PEP_ID=MMETSP0812-20130820/78474_1 /ASSEMBLY_ACC=CAM_ASM_000668 /TAXON_ID=98059 /ORGANISM="Dinobryon sp., Strain UTEXLB2267" /LENGTH=101 /DNA_ID=CAMNT_0047378229 /DNA_START=1278 /DNA_END=1583 /DNA_ORIENTATION=+
MSALKNRYIQSANDRRSDGSLRKLEYRSADSGSLVALGHFGRVEVEDELRVARHSGQHVAVDRHHQLVAVDAKRAVEELSGSLYHPLCTGSMGHLASPRPD